MKKYFLVIFLLILSGCSDDLEWKETKEAAIEDGLNASQAPSELIATETVDDYTIVTLLEDGELVFGEIVEKNGEFAWYRSFPSFDFIGNEVELGGGAHTDFETHDGTTIHVLIGRVADKNVEQVRIEDGQLNQVRNIIGDTGGYYVFSLNPFAGVYTEPVSSSEEN